MIMKMSFPTRRILAVVFSAVFLCGGLSGCKVKIKQSEGKPATSENLQKIVLTIAGVGLGFPDGNHSDEEMIAAFEKSSGAKVVVSKIAHSTNLEEYLTDLQALTRSSDLPDIILFPALSTISDKLILADITDMVTADDDWDQVPLPLRKAVTADDDIFAVPLRYSLEGYFVNQDLFEKEKRTAPAFGFTFHNFFLNVQKLAGNKQIKPLSGFYQIPLWYPLLKEDGAIWGPYGKNGFDLENKSFRDGIAYAGQLKKACYPGVKAQDMPDDVSSSSALSQWRNGQTALFYGNTENLSEIKSGRFASAFIGIPESKSVIDASYIGITASSTHKKEAFSLVRWLSFGSDGVKKRLSSQANSPGGQFPLTKNSNLSASFLAQCNDSGIAQALAKIDQAVVKAEDYLPIYYTAMLQTKYHLKDDTQERTLAELLQMAVDGKIDDTESVKELNRLVNWKEGA